MADAPSDYVQAFEEVLPGFAEFSRTEGWHLLTEKEYTIAGVFIDASRFVRYELADGRPVPVAAVLNYIESVLENGSEAGRDAATTSFLQNILNRIPKQFRAADWLPLLGPKSRAYSRAWNKLAGTGTESLPDEDPARG